MRLSERNKQPLYYATYVSEAEILDDDENPTGQHQITYSAPVAKSWNAHGVTSDAEVEMFGIAAKDTIRVVCEKSLPIDEESIIWFGKTPATPYVATAPGHNYRVAGILPTLNDAVFYAVRISE